MKLIKIAAVILIFLFSCKTTQQKNEEQYFLFERISGARVRITGYTGSGGEVRIPQLIQGMLVTAIGEEAFRGKRITGVAIPQTVNAIGAGAFRDNRLTDIVIPGSVSVLERDVFRGNRITRVRIPAGIKTIEPEAFTENRINRITIGSDVDVSINAFDNYFAAIYMHLEKKSGTYTFGSKAWRRR